MDTLVRNLKFFSSTHEKRKKVEITIEKRLTNEFVGDIMNDVVSTLGYYNRSDKV